MVGCEPSFVWVPFQSKMGFLHRDSKNEEGKQALQLQVGFHL